VITFLGYNEPSGSLSPPHSPITGSRKRDQQKTAKEQILIAEKGLFWQKRYFLKSFSGR
jgi:hypothetical protein